LEGNPNNGCAVHQRHRDLLCRLSPPNPTALSTPLTIMHVLAPAPVGGLETVVSTLAQAQSRAGNRVVVAPTLSALEEGRNFMDSLAGSAVEIEPVIVPGRRYLRERRALQDMCHRKQVDIVHSHGYRSDIIGGWAGRKSDIPIVTTVHGFAGGGWRNRRYEDLQRWSFRRFDAVVAVSRAMAAELQASGVSTSRLHTIPNALAPTPAAFNRAAARRELGLLTEGVVGGWVGRVSREKGVDVLIDALAILNDPGVHAVVLGDGPERAREENRAKSLIPETIVWLGNVPDAARYFAAFDFYVLSSRTEGIPMVLLEAMAAGIPIVTTSVGGIPDMLSPLEAMLVAPNDPAALAAAIRTTIADPAAAASRAHAAQLRQRESFAAGPWSERYDAIYRSLLSARALASAGQ
jgi:glycosyltransferase involved in cell wall biosynthesis